VLRTEDEIFSTTDRSSEGRLRKGYRQPRVLRKKGGRSSTPVSLVDTVLFGKKKKELLGEKEKVGSSRPERQENESPSTDTSMTEGEGEALLYEGFVRSNLFLPRGLRSLIKNALFRRLGGKLEFFRLLRKVFMGGGDGLKNGLFLRNESGVDKRDYIYSESFA